QRCEVAPCLRLGVALTPLLFAAEDLRQIPLLLRVVAELDDQRADHRQTERREHRRATALELLTEDEALRGIPARAAHFLRPVRRDPALLRERLMPLHHLVHLEVAVV